MSNHIISVAYKRDLRTPMRKSVMVLLADKASDDGSGIWASKQTMADELCCSKQSVISTIQDFISEGLLLELGRRKSPNGFTVEYGIVVDVLTDLPLVACHAHQSRRLTGQRAGPVKEVDLTSQPVGPEPSLTPLTSEAKASSVKRARAKSVFELPDWVPADAWGAFTEMRRAIHRRAFTDRAKKEIIDELEKLKGQGHDPGACLMGSVKNGYRDVFPPRVSVTDTAAGKPGSEIERELGANFARLQAGNITDTEFERERARLQRLERDRIANCGRSVVPAGSS